VNEIVLDDEITLRVLRPADAAVRTALAHEAQRRADPLMPWWTELPMMADVRVWAGRGSVHRDGWLVLVRGAAAGVVCVEAEPSPPNDAPTLDCWIAPRFGDCSVPSVGVNAPR
jgi:hypothetical protein